MNTQQVFISGVQLFQAGNFAGASQCFSTVVQQIPHHLDAHFLLAQCRRKLNDPDGAEKILRWLLSVRRTPEYLIMLANINIAKQAWIEAETQLRDAIELKPSFDAWVNLGRLYFVLENWSQAKVALQRSLKLRPNDVGSLISLIECYRRLGEVEQAISELKLLVHNADLNLSQLHKIAFLLHSLDHSQEAFDLLRFRIPVEGFNEGLMGLLAKLVLQHESIDGAKEFITGMLSVPSIKRRALDLLFRLEWESGKDSAFIHYESVLKSTPSEDVLEDYLRKLIKCGRFEFAYQQLNGLNEGQPNNPVLKFLKAFIVCELGHFDEALTEINALIAQSPEDGQFIEQKVKTLLSMKRAEEAFELMQLRLKLPDVKQGTYALYASVLKLSGREQEYRRLYDFDKHINCIQIDLTSNNLHERLKQKLTGMHSGNREPFEQSLRGGSQTTGHLFESGDPDIAELKERLMKQLAELFSRVDFSSSAPLNSLNVGEFTITDSWSVLLKDTHFHANHFHNAGDLSACLYLDVSGVNSHPGEGWIKFGEAELGGWVQDCPDYCVKPDTGLLVVFPSYMWHGTTPFLSDKQRMTIAFDLRFLRD
ncbi:tetratricopeptide repeat protein [Shewanella amazonensis]|uniref:TPR domain protein n=1 Tax=Shewanella amazonensis (strain ATCC BAA-1098 / SB2B) TaxID=326297 RepID=A1S504_SHEAM|nr:tetratricopeptide repeat protein [Shewanella amazonensis]ABL99460.1 hypothetical protein Sama_1253 [Shewanella amazonensis SB2B]